MANCAWTEYKVYDTKENIKLLVDAIEKEKQVRPSTPNMWNVVQNLNIEDDNYSIRGTLIDTELSEDGTSLLMAWDCSWDWQPDFVTALQTKFPNMESCLRLCKDTKIKANHNPPAGRGSSAHVV